MTDQAGLIERFRASAQRTTIWQRALLFAIVLGLAGILIRYMWARPGSIDVAEEGELETNIVQIGVEAQENIDLAFATAERKELRSAVITTGIVSADPTRYAHIVPLGRGIVETVHVNLGDRVQGGEPLVSYDNIELGDLIGEFLYLQAELAKFEAEREVARKILDRAGDLLQVEAISRQEHEVRQAEHQRAVATVQSQRADLARVEEKLHRLGLVHEEIEALTTSPHDSSRHRTASHNILRAPFDGIIIEYDVAPGELVERDQRLFTLADTSTVWVLADVYEKDLRLVREGEECDVHIASYPEKSFHGQVTYVSDFLDPTSRTAKVRCVVSNIDGELKLEMFAQVEIPVEHGRVALVVPITCLQQIDQDTVLFVQREATRFEKKVVVIGERRQDWAEVLSGLEEDERVVTMGSFYLKSMLLRELIGEGEEE